MQARIDIEAELPEAYEAMLALGRAVVLDDRLRVLVKLRASMINGCVYCIDLYSREGLASGESEQRLSELAAWEESPHFNDRERAALALTDAITRIAGGQVPDALWAEACKYFDSAELARLIWAVTAINSWNRVAISTRILPAA